jgi:hypothetical protein
MIVNDELERIWKEAVVMCVRTNARLCAGRESNRLPLNYKPDTLPLEAIYFV